MVDFPASYVSLPEGTSRYTTVGFFFRDPDTELLAGYNPSLSPGVGINLGMVLNPPCNPTEPHAFLCGAPPCHPATPPNSKMSKADPLVAA